MRHAARIAAAYLAVSLSSGLVVALSTAWNHFADAPLICALVTAYAFVPALAAIVIAERRSISRYGYYGGVGAALGAVLPWAALGRHAEWSLSLFGLALGPAAGWIYWRIAGRHAGVWR